jgi:hypothetical protein
MASGYGKGKSRREPDLVRFGENLSRCDPSRGTRRSASRMPSVFIAPTSEHANGASTVCRSRI